MSFCGLGKIFVTLIISANWNSPSYVNKALMFCDILKFDFFSLLPGSADFVTKMGLKDSSGSKKVPGLCSDTAYELDGTAILKKDKLISQTQEVKTASIFSVFKLTKDNEGYLFTTYFSDATPMMALKAHPLTFEYSDTKGNVYSTSIRGNINDGKWHTLAIAINDEALEFLVDCVSVTRVPKPIDFNISDILKNEGPTLLGSRLDGNTKFEVCVFLSVSVEWRGHGKGWGGGGGGGRPDPFYGRKR